MSQESQTPVGSNPPFLAALESFSHNSQGWVSPLAHGLMAAMGQPWEGLISLGTVLGFPHLLLCHCAPSCAHGEER